MKLVWLLTFFIPHIVFSIKFDYVAGKHEFICFHEDVQKESRFQVIVKAAKPTYSLQLFEEQNSVYEDDRSDAFIKEYSAFSKINGQLMICLANKDFEDPITYAIQFYHGIHLDGYSSIADTDSFSQLWEIMAQIFQMQNFIKMAYDMNVKTLIERNQIVSSLGAIITLATLAFFIMLGISRTLLISKLKKLLRQKKMI